MIFIADDQLDTKSIINMRGILNDHNAINSLCTVSYLDEDNFKRNEDDIAKEIRANMVLKMTIVLPSDVQKALPTFNRYEDVIQTPEDEVLYIMRAFDDYVKKCKEDGILLNGRDVRFAFMIDLSADSSSQTPDTSYGVTVVRELALLLKPNDETNRQDKIRCAIKEFYGDSRYLTIFYSKHNFCPDLINTYWYLSVQKKQINVNSASKINSWIREPFQHSKKCPIIYKTNRSAHDGKILPKIIEWETTNFP